MRALLTLLVALLIGAPAFADTYNAFPYPTAVWDTTLGQIYALGVPGQGQTGLTVLPLQNTANTWTNTNSFSGTLATTGKIATQGVPFSTVESGNPLVLQTIQTVSLASVNQTGGYTLLSGVPGRTIYPSDVYVVTLGANAATDVGIKILCTSGNVLLSAATSALLASTAVSVGASNVSGGLGYAGCAVGDSLLISNIGSNMTGPTGIVVNVPYTIQ